MLSSFEIRRLSPKERAKYFRQKELNDLKILSDISKNISEEQQHLKEGITPEVRDNRTLAEKEEDKVLQSQTAQKNALKLFKNDGKEAQDFLNKLKNSRYKNFVDFNKYFLGMFSSLSNKVGKVRAQEMYDFVNRYLENQKNTSGIRNLLSSEQEVDAIIRHLTSIAGISNETKNDLNDRLEALQLTLESSIKKYGESKVKQAYEMSDLPDFDEEFDEDTIVPEIQKIDKKSLESFARQFQNYPVSDDYSLYDDYSVSDYHDDSISSITNQDEDFHIYSNTDYDFDFDEEKEEKEETEMKEVKEVYDEKTQRAINKVNSMTLEEMKAMSANVVRLIRILNQGGDEYKDSSTRVNKDDLKSYNEVAPLFTPKGGKATGIQKKSLYNFVKDSGIKTIDRLLRERIAEQEGNIAEAKQPREPRKSITRTIHDIRREEEEMKRKDDDEDEVEEEPQEDIIKDGNGLKIKKIGSMRVRFG